MNNQLLIRVTGILVAMTTICFCQSHSDPFMKLVPAIRLDNETVIVGIVRLSQASGLALSIEYPLAESLNGHSPTLQKFQTEVEAGTVSDTLNKLTALDNTFAWQESGNMINLFPRSTLGDNRYVMNRTLESLSYDNVTDVEKAVFSAVGHLAPPREQIAMLQAGTILALPKPWTTTLHNVAVREVLNLLVTQVGPQYGWELSGSKQFRVVQFHAGYSERRTDVPIPTN